jgi:hypothetical protein
MGNEDSWDLDIELEGDGALNIYEDLHVIAYLQTIEVLVILTPKKHEQVVHRAK